ncbi:hypothetical protein BAQ47_03190 [Bacillus tropicus]|uniref:hypothetical protein n=1 Tax=Bacillus tropicus TaxID=2026188 RepID=UPI0008FE11E9|nr:hypothetical protein [Bacillus tropicus]OJE31667.1 hypothetical protein BAQ47_03190 [Bacillus tropicus]
MEKRNKVFKEDIKGAKRSKRKLKKFSRGGYVWDIKRAIDGSKKSYYRGGELLSKHREDDDIQKEMDRLFPEYKLEDIQRYIEIMQKTSGYKSCKAYWQAVQEGKEKGYSIAELKKWERMEKALKELKQ